MSCEHMCKNCVDSENCKVMGCTKPDDYQCVICKKESENTGNYKNESWKIMNRCFHARSGACNIKQELKRDCPENCVLYPKIEQKPSPRMVTIEQAVKDELMVKLAEQTEFRPAIKAIKKEICSRPHRSWDLFNLPVWEVEGGR